MRPAFAEESGRTTALRWGLAGWRLADLEYVVSRAAASAAALGALAVGALALTVVYDPCPWVDPGTLDLELVWQA